MKGDKDFKIRAKAILREYSENITALPGINSENSMDSFLFQLIDSIHRVEYIQKLKDDDRLSDNRMDPNNIKMFDPLFAAILNKRAGNVEESFWLLFLFVHFGKHKTAGWRYAREVYAGNGNRWTWERTKNNIDEFRDWLDQYQHQVRIIGGNRGFHNHRKFESLSGNGSNGTGAVVESYVNWIVSNESHESLFNNVLISTNHDPKLSFKKLYQSMNIVKRFGRLARFDYLCVVGKLGFASIEPDQTYWKEGTGPKEGTLLLFGNSIPNNQIDSKLWEIARKLELGPFSMQILEDAICNWQKSPSRYLRFNG